MVRQRIDDNSLEVHERMPFRLHKIRKRYHGNVKKSNSLRGKDMYEWVDTFEQTGGLPSLYKRFPILKKRMDSIRKAKVIRVGESQYVDRELAKLWYYLFNTYENTIESYKKGGWLK